MKRGFWFALGAYLTWGVFPVYWQLLKHVPALELLSHRIIWSLVSLAIAISLARQWGEFRAQALTGKMLGLYSVAGVLIGINWLIYVWAVNADFIVETSLGYFINPLLSVLLGVIFFRERLRPFQWIPVGLAALGVVYLTFVYGQPPLIALSLAFSFGFYGMVKKMAPLSSLFGLTLETGILLLPALGYLGYMEFTGQAAFLKTGLSADLLMVGAGLVTTIPLLMFASAARAIPLSALGIMQYIAPTMQFLIGVLVFKEEFTPTMAVGFGIVWVALVLFWGEGFHHNRQTALAAAAVELPGK